MKRILTAFAALACITVSSFMFSSCVDDGMNDENFSYTYNANSSDINYSDAPGYFNVAIKEAIGSEPVWGGGDYDDKVIKACNECYEILKPLLQGKSGKVNITKTRHPDGKRKDIKEYKF